MPTTLERVAQRLYRVGLRHEHGDSSLLSLAAKPARMLVGELAASMADTFSTSGEHRADGGSHDRPGRGIGPSTA